MIIICAHVPMSPRVRTSVPDLWSQHKGTKKEWSGYVNMLIGIPEWRVTFVCGWIIVLARQSSL